MVTGSLALGSELTELQRGAEKPRRLSMVSFLRNPPVLTSDPGDGVAGDGDEDMDIAEGDLVNRSDPRTRFMFCLPL